MHSSATAVSEPSFDSASGGSTGSQDSFVCSGTSPGSTAPTSANPPAAPASSLAPRVSRCINRPQKLFEQLGQICHHCSSQAFKELRGAA
jgi:hypothetical protein